MGGTRPYLVPAPRARAMTSSGIRRLPTGREVRHACRTTECRGSDTRRGMLPTFGVEAVGEPADDRALAVVLTNLMTWPARFHGAVLV